MESLVMPNTPWWQRQVAMRTHRPQRRRGIKEWVPDRRPPPLGTARPVVARIIREGKQTSGKKDIVDKFQRQKQGPQGHEGAQRGQVEVRQRQEGKKPQTGRRNRFERGSKVWREDSQEEKEILASAPLSETRRRTLTKSRRPVRRPLSA